MSAIRTSLIAIGLALSWPDPAEHVYAQSAELAPGSVDLLVVSEPAGASVFINNQAAGLTTPASINRPEGETLVEVMLEGYEPLSKSVRVHAGQTTTFHFLLKSFPPAPLLPESLGLTKLPVLPLLNEVIAEHAEKKWSNLTEIFAIVPFGQGILAKVILPSDQQKSANAMIISGVALTVSTHVIAKAVGRRKLKWVRQRNHEIPIENDSAARHNAEVDKMVADANRQAMDSWLKENEQRGKVSVHIE